MDGAWALYEAWVKLQLGEVDTALIYSYGKSSPGPVARSAEPPARPVLRGPVVARRDLAGRAAGAGAARGGQGDREGDRRGRRPQPCVRRSTTRTRSSSGTSPADEVLAESMLVDPLRKDDCPPITDGVAAVVLAADDVARAALRPARVDPGHRPPHRVRGARAARPHRLAVDPQVGGRTAGVGDGTVDVAELHAPFSHQELILRDALGLGDGVDINPSGGALCANPIMAAGLIRFGEAANG